MKNNAFEVIKTANYEGIEGRIMKLKHTLKANSPIKLHANFYYLTFKGTVPSLDEFVQIVYDKILNYCIPRAEIDNAIREVHKTRDPKHLTHLQDQARNLFIRNYKRNDSKSGAHLGEPGELIFYILMEAFFNAPQIACKMYLKTNENMPVHGSDGIHIKFDDQSNQLVLYWGESKLYMKLSDAFDEIFSSIGNFISTNDVRNPRDRDIDIIKNHSNINTEKAKKELLKYFNPYNAESNNLREVFACFVGFDYTLYKNLADKSNDEVESYFTQEYLKRAEKAFELFGEKITKNKVQHLEFCLLLLPFPSVEEMRDKFFAKLGIRPI